MLFTISADLRVCAFDEGEGLGFALRLREQQGQGSLEHSGFDGGMRLVEFDRASKGTFGIRQRPLVEKGLGEFASNLGFKFGVV